MLILTRHEIESLLTVNDVIAAVEAGFAQLSAGGVVMPQRVPTQVAPYGGMHLSMPVFVSGDPGTLSIKAITVYPDNPAKYGLPMVQGVVLLYDAVNGKLLAMMDAEEVTAMRTGAASGVATKHLARADASTVLLFGAGAVGPAQLAAVCAVRPIQKAFVITRSGDKDAEFCEKMAQRLGIEVEPIRNPQSAVRNSDIICTATTSSTPLFDGTWLQPGTHINGVGSYNARMQEVDATTVRRARVFVDRIQAAQTEAGDLLIPINKGEITLDHIAGELGQVINGTLAGRSNAEEITFFKSVGTAMQDAVTASVVYRKALAQGMGQEISLV
ncbi:MAG: ornithine cyclodeaminase family protein [Caldilineaceae bacterium]